MERKIYSCCITVCLLLTLMSLHAPSALAEDEPFVGEMIWVPYNFPPRGWAFCDGQVLSIAQNTALFSLLGTTYGGNGQTTFALPDMRGKVMLNAGQAAGLSDYQQGQSGGAATTTLTTAQMPAHSHVFMASTTTGDVATPASNTVYGAAGSEKQYGPNSTATMAVAALSVAGSSLPHNNMMPYGTLNCIIALQGIFPARP